MSKRKIKVDDLDISIISKDDGDFICLTDIARTTEERRRAQRQILPQQDF